MLQLREYTTQSTDHMHLKYAAYIKQVFRFNVSSNMIKSNNRLFLDE